MTTDREDSKTNREQDSERRGGMNRRAVLKSIGTSVVGASLLGSQSIDPARAASEVVELVPESDATHVATSNGGWLNENTWDTGVPDSEARVYVPAGQTVTVDGTTSPLRWVRVDGTLRFRTTADSHLRVDTLVTTEGSTYEMGTTDDPIPPGTTAQVTFTDSGPIDESWDPTRHSRGFLPMGAVEIVGAEKTTHTTLSQHPTAGDTSIELESAPTNWEVGDSLVVPGVSARENQDEEVTVESIHDATVTLETALAYDHVPPASDLNTYVLNLDRTARFRSAATETKRRGHVMIMSPGSTIQYAGFYELGRTDKNERFSDPEYGGSQLTMDENENRKSRYAVHFHTTGPTRDVEPHVTTGSVVAPRLDATGSSASPGWGFVNHQSHAIVEDCITYRVFGTGFMTETGVEIGRFRNNFALRSEGSGRDPDWREFIENINRERNIDDFGHGGHGFWLQGPLVTVENNVAAGHRNFAYAYWNRALGDYVPDPLPYDDPAAKDPPTDEMSEAELGRHRGNVPNVPAGYADHKPTSEHNVAPGTPGPNVAAFAHATYRADDGTVYVDEGSIPIHNVDNVAFASGSGIDIMNHMRGVDNDSVAGHEEYYGRVTNFTGWNLRGRDGEDDLRHTTLDGFGGVRGVDLGIGLRYSKFVRIQNARLIGDDRGVGISHNMRMDGLVIEDTTIEGFDDGIGALNPGRTDIRNTTCTTSNAGVYIRGERIFGGEPTTVLSNVTGTVELSPDLIDSVTTGPWDQQLTLDGAELFYAEQAPDHVLVPDRAAYDALGGYDTFGVAAGDVVGRTTSELDELYDLAPFGIVAPPNAEPTPQLDGGLIAENGDDPGTGPSTFAVNAGGSSFTASNGTTYQADTAYTGGGTAGTADPIANTEDDTLYQSERAGEFTYDIPVTDGTYDVVLHFVELYWNATGSRVFDVTVDGTDAITGLNVYAQVGHDTSLRETVSDVTVTDGSLTIEFTTQVDNATVSAIEVVPQ